MMVKRALRTALAGFAALTAVSVPSAAQEPDAQLIARAVESISAGQPVSALEGMPEISADQSATLAALKGCAPSIGEGSTRQFVRIAFRCEREGQLPTRQFVIFVFEESGLERVSTTFLPSAIGPTQTALETSDMKRELNTLRDFVKAVRKQQDPSLGGLVPLSSPQREQLKRMSECKWQVFRDRSRGTKDRSQSAFADCKKSEDAPQYFVWMQFNEKRQPVSVEIEYGAMRTVTSVISL